MNIYQVDDLRQVKRMRLKALRDRIIRRWAFITLLILILLNIFTYSLEISVILRLIISGVLGFFLYLIPLIIYEGKLYKQYLKDY
jgi:uncharacterized membrane protein